MRIGKIGFWLALAPWVIFLATLVGPLLGIPGFG